eukprot:COSAG02_NODE_234_length_27784_cov_12.556872_13_plen_58_part_00
MRQVFAQRLVFPAVSFHFSTTSACHHIGEGIAIEGRKWKTSRIGDIGYITEIEKCSN